MKSLFKKVIVAASGFLCLIGITVSSSAIAMSNDSGLLSINDISEETPLYLYHGSEMYSNDGPVLQMHYSHVSHQSHVSHYSHRSHYSSRY